IEAQGLKVDLLVNNAGYGVSGFFASQPWEKHADFLQVLVTSAAHLTHLCLPGMMARGFGYIINVASLAGLLPGGPGHTLYGAAKSFLIKFSESLAPEVRRKNVYVTAVCPGFTYSEFHDVLGNREQVSQLPKWLWMDADKVARQGLNAAARGEIVYVNGGINRAIASAFRLLPERLAQRSIQRRAARIRVQG
ncbi:MAG TPA: SDR family NAD(P)-dependent oxidoreductase, partial [Polyangiaceae bacterium]|nr:SDR family NAD(P)-dependent oxidoreductase [Polyangiaceae bacterium]